MNKKGFTLIEIIAVVIILGVIAIIAYATYASSMKGFRDDYYADLVRTLDESGKEFFNDNRQYRPQTILGGQKVSVSTLESKSYIENIVDYNGEKCDSKSYVIAIKEGKDDYTYHTCLVCSEDEYDNTKDNKYCDAAWLDPTTVEYGLGTIEPLYVYKGTPRGELREKLEIEVSYLKKDHNGNVIGEARGTGEDDVPTILPKNVDEIDTNVVGTYPLTYEYNGQTKEGKVIVYENEGPLYDLTYKDEVAGNLNGTKITQTGKYETGTWHQRIFIKISSGGEIVEPGVKISRYQWNKNGRWQDFCVMQDSGKCVPQGAFLKNATDAGLTDYFEITQDMNEDIEFRMVATNGKISKLSKKITIRKDNTDPTCEVKTTGKMGDNMWYVSDVDITFANKYDVANSVPAPEAISGIKVHNITISTGALSRTTSNELRVHTQDTAGVTYKGYVEDKAGNFHICSVNFKRDATKPKCELQLAGTMGNKNWYVSPTVVVSFKSNTDNLSGVAQYGIRGFTAPRIINHTKDTGGITYTGFIKDDAGNSDTCEISFKKDSTKPKCTSSGGSGDWVTSRTIKGTCEDDMSKCVDDNITKKYSSTTDSTTESPGTVEDNAGNKTECPSNQTVKVDTTKPTCSTSKSNTGSTGGVTVTVTCSDTNSGCKEASSSHSSVKSDKTYTVKDNVGNEGTCSVSITKYDCNCVCVGGYDYGGWYHTGSSGNEYTTGNCSSHNYTHDTEKKKCTGELFCDCEYYARSKTWNSCKTQNCDTCYK